MVHLLEGGLDVVDADLLGDERVEVEAARDQGASGFQILTNVILPLSKPGLMIGSIFVAALKMLVVPLVFVSLICGVTALGDIAQPGRIGLKALVFYLFYVAGLIWFVSLPALRAEAPAQAALGGAFLGALAYGTYEFTKSGNWYYVAYITRDGKNTYKFTYLPEQSFSTTGCF